MTIMYISTAPHTIFLILQIITSCNRSAKAGIYISSPAAVTMKILQQAEGLPGNYTIRISGTSSTCGVPNGLMIGIPGEKCFRIILVHDFKTLHEWQLSYWFLNYFELPIQTITVI